MSNILLCHSNRVDAGTLSNGLWSASFPLNNLKDGNIDKITRSTNAVATSTRFAIDLGAVYPLWAVALVNHNLSAAATWTVKGGTAAPDASNNFATGQVFTSGSMNVKQMTFNWDMPSNWGSIYPALYALAAAQSVRYLTVDIVDTANTAGYVQIGRMFAGTGLQPSVNPKLGMQDGWLEFSSFNRADYGKKYFNKRSRKARQVDLDLGMLSPTEATQLHELEAIAGITEELLYIPDPADLATSQRYGFLANFRELSPIEYAYLTFRTKGIHLEEKL